MSACLAVSNYNNPLGSCIPDDNKRALVDLLAARDIPLIENDIFGEIHFQDRRPSAAKAYDRKGLVMLCSSFSKSLCPGFRVGWGVPGRFMAAIRFHAQQMWRPAITAAGVAGGGISRPAPARRLGAWQIPRWVINLSPIR